MRRPAHAAKSAMQLAAVVFEANGRKALISANGADPSSIAKEVVSHKDITPMERTHIRQKVRDGLRAMQAKEIDNLDFMQLSIGKRRVRLKRMS